MAKNTETARIAGLSEHYEVHVDRDATNDFVTVKAEARAESARKVQSL